MRSLYEIALIWMMALLFMLIVPNHELTNAENDDATQRIASEPYAWRTYGADGGEYVHGSSLSLQKIAQVLHAHSPKQELDFLSGDDNGDNADNGDGDRAAAYTYETAVVARDEEVKANYEIMQVAKVLPNLLGMNKHVTGRFIRIVNPLHHFSVLESASGCDGNGKNTVRETLNLKAAANDTAYQCRTATNAGFFSTRNGACYGNVVSNGRATKIESRMNAQFGITKCGKYVVGYFDPADEKNRETHVSNLEQLISGVIWLVRRRENFVTASEKVEDLSFQETGDLFVTIAASRLAIGHDEKGRLLILQIDGDGRQNVRKGVNLHQLAEWIMELGAVNAINLDGGGSSTVVSSGEVINSVTDGCDEKEVPYDFARCEREVATITCIHDIVKNEEKDSSEMTNLSRDSIIESLKSLLTTMGLLIAVLCVAVFVLLLVVTILVVRHLHRKHVASIESSDGKENYRFLLHDIESDDEDEDGGVKFMDEELIGLASNRELKSFPEGDSNLRRLT